MVEVDAKYIGGMLNKPDIQLNATINRWITAILLFDFKLVHTPAKEHKGPDGLSRRRRVEGDLEEQEGRRKTGLMSCWTWECGLTRGGSKGKVGRERQI